MNGIVINGETISKTEAASLVKMLLNDAKRMAGEFHNMERSEKFRINWPDEYLYADANWKSFVDPTRKLYAEMLANPKTPPADARKMHLALVLQAMMSKGEETDNRLQIAPNTQAFVGDRRENAKTLEKFGKTPNLRAALMNSTASRH